MKQVNAITQAADEEELRCKTHVFLFIEKYQHGKQY
jgi:hypothetical protein